MIIFLKKFTISTHSKMVKYVNKGISSKEKNMKIMEIPHQERPREKLMKYGKASLSNAELLAIVIGSGTKSKSSMELAMDILAADSRGIGYLAECTPEELMKIEGVGYAKTCELIAAVELGRRVSVLPMAQRTRITSSYDVSNYFMNKMRYYNKEHFISVLLNVKGEIIEEVEVSVGDLNSSMTHPREVFVQAVRRSAGSIIFVHNHPSGDPSPSQTDIDTTNRMIQVGELLGIPVLDHIIIGDGIYVSMKSSGYMDN